MEKSTGGAPFSFSRIDTRNGGWLGKSTPGTP